MDRSTFSVKHQDEGLFDLYGRKRVLSFILVITLITFVPLGVKNILLGESLLGGLLLAFELSLVVEVIGVFRFKRNIIGYKLPLTLLATSIILSIDIFGTLATYWVFPVVTTIVFMVPKKIALLSNTMIILGSTIAVLPHQEPMVTLRFVLALFFCVSISHVVIEAVRRLQRNLITLSTKDSLTGVYNRHQMDISLQAASQRAKTGEASCIALIDIDYLKKVNDFYGHDVGDRVIKSVAELISSHCRKTDLLFRLGGDEFLLLFDGIWQECALERLQRIKDEVVIEVVKECPQTKGITLSTGLAESLANEESEHWVKRADLALYEAKLAGRDQIKINGSPRCYTDAAVTVS
ncbi:MULTISPECIES: GGDEF domain-containing protein [unclassified Shewanella]|uniref:GGDEF domain-containing protein n=1 Tax=unclassified Shewanella TaxID=196818 RepID=UPI001BB8E6CF|nr:MULTISPECIES: GGDEF domain-containing protein [unclassified Shewanella]GIU04961.1 GGDEF domain-containing protein [Shewanella sp. MBTL60-112-B1]GIU24583.1 GGDEF domain-containing protein [Shewanella sp. MBTL60-112-B2]